MVSDASAEKNRVEKLLEDAQIKLSVVASDIFGVSGRDMMNALISGQRDPRVLAQLARSRMRVKIPRLEEAFHGYFTDHHAFLLSKMLSRIDQICADIAAIDAKIEDEIAPFAEAVERLDQIPGVGVIAARVIIAEVGMDMTRFPTPAHLASWARFAPGIKESAGRKKGNGATGHGNPYLASVLGEAAISAGTSRRAARFRSSAAKPTWGAPSRWSDWGLPVSERCLVMASTRSRITAATASASPLGNLLNNPCCPCGVHDDLAHEHASR